MPAQRNHHWTKTLAASPDGSRLYVGVGSNSNVAEHGMAEEEGRAAIWEIDPASGAHRIFASGLRNPVGIAFRPGSADLYAVVNERDELGSDLVPDYLTRVQPGAFYGWPWSYWGSHVDTRVEPANPAMVARAIAPDYALGNHVAPLGLAFSARRAARPGLRLGRLHRPARLVEPPAAQRLSGRLRPLRQWRSDGPAVPVLTGFISAEGNAMGRPVGVQIARDGALLVADDVGNTIWRVSAAR